LPREYGYDLEPVPREGRVYGFWENFAIWFGADAGIAVFWAGALLTPSLPLPIATALILAGVAVGNVFMSAIAVMGYRTGVPTMVLARGALGVRGSALPSLLNYLQLIGWSAIVIVVGARAADYILTSLAGFSAFHAWVLAIGAALTAWSFLGPERWRWVENVSVALLLVLTAWLTYVTLTRFSIPELLKAPASGGMSYWLGLDLVIAMPISWVPLVADYSRFARRYRDAFWGTYVGHFISCALFYFVGALTNVAVGAPDPISIIASYGLGIPAMLIVIFTTLTTGFLDIYSAVISLKNVFTWVNVRRHVVVVGVASTLIALMFPVEAYEWFLLLIIGAFVPLTSIMIIDYLARRYDPRSLLAGEGGPYWYRGGINLPAMAVWAVGFAFSVALSATLNLGIDIPLISDVAYSMGSSIPSLLLTAALYTAVALRPRP